MLTDFWIGAVFAIAVPIGGAVGQQLVVRTTIAILLRIINIFPFVESPFDMGGTTVTDDAVNCSIFEPLADRCGHVTSIEADSFGLKVKALSLSIEALKIGNAVVDVGGSDMGIGN